MTFHTFGTLPAGNVPASYLDDNFTALAAAIVNYGVDTGTTNALAITTALTIAAYADGQVYAVKVANTNTSTATLNVDGLGTKNIYRSDTSALQPNDLVSGSTYILIYNAALNTNIGGFQMDGPPALSPAFHARVSVNQTSGTTVIFDTVDNQIGSSYNNASGVFTAPVTGAYLFAASVAVTNTSGGSLFFQVFIATTSFAAGVCACNQSVPTGGNGNLPISTVVFLTAGQTASVGISVAGGLSATRLVAAGAITSFSGCLMYHT